MIKSNKMKKFLIIVLTLMAAAVLMAVDCEYGSHNGHYTDQFETKYFDEPLQIYLSVKVITTNSQNENNMPVSNAAVHFFNSDTIILTDTAGYAGTSFFIDSVPFKYGYDIKKNGYKYYFVNMNGIDTVSQISQVVKLVEN